MANNSIVNAMTVDVEDFFQVSAFERYIARADWDKMQLRAIDSTNRVLDIFAEHKISATFFTLGWIAEKSPGLIRRIVDEGHELASHGYEHVRVTEQKRDMFRQDVIRTKALLEDISGSAVNGYRAASYSINLTNLWALDELQEAGYTYSSSIYPIKHDLYGVPDAPRFAFRPLDSEFVEIPVSTFQMGKRRLPCGGGGFFRLYPYRLSRFAIKHLNINEQQPVIFYFHPWEIDPAQPRIKDISLKARFRHYLNLSRMESRIVQLVKHFQWARMDEVFKMESDAEYPLYRLGELKD